MAKAYSFLKDKKTEEKHIFEGDFRPESCSANQKSICQKDIKNDGNWVSSATCLSEDAARKKAAELGRSVCGVCVSHLYSTNY